MTLVAKLSAMSTCRRTQLDVGAGAIMAWHAHYNPELGLGIRLAGKSAPDCNKSFVLKLPQGQADPG